MRSLFRRYIDKNAVIVNVAAGYCEFINNIIAKEKIAINMNPDVRKSASKGVKVIEASVFDMDRYIEKALIETVDMCGLKVEKCITRFLPYTTKSALPKAGFILKMYLYLMLLSGFFFGKQSFLVLSKQR